jgi:hypothetical protein
MDVNIRAGEKSMLKGQDAKDYVEKALSHEKEINGGLNFGEGEIEGEAGYYQDGRVFVAFDNRDFCCWVEELKTSRKAVMWINGHIDAEGHLTKPRLSKKQKELNSKVYEVSGKEMAELATFFNSVMDDFEIPTEIHEEAHTISAMLSREGF